MISSKKLRRNRANASYWIAKLRAGPLSDSDRRRFESWRAAHPSNHSAVEHVLRERREVTKPFRPTERRAASLYRRRASLLARLWRSKRLRVFAVAALVIGAGFFLTMEARAAGGELPSTPSTSTPAVLTPPSISIV